ncbi:MAG: hypothetical protein P4L82_12140 [Ancalomicrobiaceae bacterium]|nr:hypothetical protein [Ancalomicrobiaceae bacterium]
MADRTLRSLLGETRGEGFEHFERLIAETATTPKERLIGRYLDLFSTAAIEAAREHPDADPVDIFTAAPFAAGFAIAAMLFQAVDPAGYAGGRKLMTKQFASGLFEGLKAIREASGSKP